MEPLLPTFSLPLPPNGPPEGFEWKEGAISAYSTTTAFGSGLDQRDAFLGKRRCVVCGESERELLEHCHIIPDSEPETWTELKDRRYIPEQAKGKPRHEPRDGLLMCLHHHKLFDKYRFFIRYVPQAERFIIVNYAGTPNLQSFHGKAIALDLEHQHTPFPSIFLIHEMRVRAWNPFRPASTSVPREILWQDWILADGVFDDAMKSFIRKEAARKAPRIDEADLTVGMSTPNDMVELAELNGNTIGAILDATRSMPSWKACQREGMSWKGTAEENIERYMVDVGVERLNGIDSRLGRMEKKADSRDINQLARIHNTFVTTDDARLEPLVNVAEGVAIDKFPATLGDLLQLSGDDVRKILAALGEEDGSRSHMNEEQLKTYRGRLARMIGVRELTQTKRF